MENRYLKFGARILLKENEEVYWEKARIPNDRMTGFNLSFDVRILQMFAETYALVGSTRKGLLKVKDRFTYDSAPFEYVFDLGDGFYAVIYSVSNPGLYEYRVKCSILKAKMTNEDSMTILSKVVRDYIIFFKAMQEKLIKKSTNDLDSVILADGLKDSLLNDITMFLKSKDKYRKLGLAWKRGYIFHGVPGNGKTLFLRKFGEAFGLELIDMLDRIDNRGVLSLPQEFRLDEYRNQESLDLHELAFESDPDVSPSIYYLEDMDKVLGKNDADHSRITLANFLNAIDGVNKLADGVIIVGTTNNKDALADSILGRPGRFDRVYEFTPPEKKEIIKFFNNKNFLVENVKKTETYASKMYEKNFSMAFVEDFVVSCVSQSNKKDNIVTDTVAKDVYKKVLEHVTITQNTTNIGFNG
jgi:SpoVK/Ycf46/Vps4 family AAA+-type ATPase